MLLILLLLDNGPYFRIFSCWVFWWINSWDLFVPFCLVLPSFCLLPAIKCCCEYMLSFRKCLKFLWFTHVSLYPSMCALLTSPPLLFLSHQQQCEVPTSILRVSTRRRGLPYRAALILVQLHHDPKPDPRTSRSFHDDGPASHTPPPRFRAEDPRRPRKRPGSCWHGLFPSEEGQGQQGGGVTVEGGERAPGRGAAAQYEYLQQGIHRAERGDILWNSRRCLQGVCYWRPMEWAPAWLKEKINDDLEQFNQ